MKFIRADTWVRPCANPTISVKPPTLHSSGDGTSLRIRIRLYQPRHSPPHQIGRPAEEFGYIPHLRCADRAEIQLDEFLPCLGLANRTRFLRQLWHVASRDVIAEGVFPGTGFGNSIGRILKSICRSSNARLKTDSLAFNSALPCAGKSCPASLCPGGSRRAVWQPGSAALLRT